MLHSYFDLYVNFKIVLSVLGSPLPRHLPHSCRVSHSTRQHSFSLCVGFAMLVHSSFNACCTSDPPVLVLMWFSVATKLLYFAHPVSINSSSSCTSSRTADRLRLLDQYLSLQQRLPGFLVRHMLQSVIRPSNFPASEVIPQQCKV